MPSPLRALIFGSLLQTGLLGTAAAACSDTLPYPVTLYDAPGQPGYVDFTLTVDQMAAKMGGYAQLLKNLRYVADMDNNTYGGPYGQQVQQKVTRAIAAVVACQQEEQRSQAEAKAQQQQAAAAQAAPPVARGIDPSLYNTEDNSDGNQLFRQMAAAGTPFTPLNPQKNHTGEPCVYFTKPLVRPDGGGLNAYADGAHVAYGKYYYSCRNGRWFSIGPASAYLNNAQEHAAERLERSTLSTQIYEKE